MKRKVHGNRIENCKEDLYCYNPKALEFFFFIAALAIYKEVLGKKHRHTIETYNNIAATLNKRGCEFGNKGDFDAAIADLTEAVKLKIDNAMYFNNRGFWYGSKGDFDLAIAGFNEAIRLKPDYPNPYRWRGKVYVKLSEYDKAIADFDKALELKPGYADAAVDRQAAI